MNITKIPKTRTTYKGYRDYEPAIYSTDKIPMLERAKMFAKANPKTTIGAGTVGVTSGIIPDTIGAIGTGIKNTGLQIADLLVSDKYFDQDKYFADKEKAKLDKENTTTLNTDIKKLLEQPTKPKKSEKELRAEQIAKYRDIVDIKGMNKNAAYDALIAASQAVLGEGDIKSSLKDGSLINKIIGSTSRAYDKPAKTKDAINSLILKGEIEKDIATAKPGSQYKAASDYASMQGVSIDQAYKDLGFSKVNNIATNLTAVNKSLGQSSTSSETLDQAIRLSQDGVIPKVLVNDSKLLEYAKRDDYVDEIDLFQNTVAKEQLGPGVYIIGTKAFQIDEEGNQSQLY